MGGEIYDPEVYRHPDYEALFDELEQLLAVNSAQAVTPNGITVSRTGITSHEGIVDREITIQGHYHTESLDNTYTVAIKGVGRFIYGSYGPLAYIAGEQQQEEMYLIDSRKSHPTSMLGILRATHFVELNDEQGNAGGAHA